MCSTRPECTLLSVPYALISCRTLSNIPCALHFQNTHCLTVTSHVPLYPRRTFFNIPCAQSIRESTVFHISHALLYSLHLYVNTCVCVYAGWWRRHFRSAWQAEQQRQAQGRQAQRSTCCCSAVFSFKKVPVILLKISARKFVSFYAKSADLCQKLQFFEQGLSWQHRESAPLPRPQSWHRFW